MVLMIVAGLIGLGLIISLIYVFSLPTDQKSRRHKHKKELEKTEASINLQPTVERLEKTILSFKKEIEDLQKKEKIKEKELLVEKVKVKKLEEKLIQERGWLEKEQSAIDKGSVELKKYKDELMKVQEEFGREHAAYLRLKSDFQELTRRHEAVVEQKRKLELETAQGKTEIKNSREEIQELKREAANLKKSKDDTTFVSKSEYTELEKQLKEKEVELERLKRSTQGS